jgi:hypothetical protein
MINTKPPSKTRKTCSKFPGLPQILRGGGCSLEGSGPEKAAGKAAAVGHGEGNRFPEGGPALGIQLDKIQQIPGAGVQVAGEFQHHLTVRNSSGDFARDTDRSPRPGGSGPDAIHRKARRRCIGVWFRRKNTPAAKADRVRHGLAVEQQKKRASGRIAGNLQGSGMRGGISGAERDPERGVCARGQGVGSARRIKDKGSGIFPVRLAAMPVRSEDPGLEITTSNSAANRRTRR